MGQDKYIIDNKNFKEFLIILAVTMISIFSVVALASFYCALGNFDLSGMNKDKSPLVKIIEFIIIKGRICTIEYMSE